MIPLHPPQLSWAMILMSLATLNLNVASAAEVNVQLSSDEAYVGSPIELNIEIVNASSYERPRPLDVDGLDIQSAGQAMESLQRTYSGGRLRQTHVVVLRYLVTPLRAGDFQIPELTMRVDNEELKIPAQSFVAKKSETGDLLFAELEGKQARVFVGQPLEMMLKIYIKPFRDPAQRIVLSEANMWQMLSTKTKWGSFVDRVREMAKINQRPGGREVLREDGEGNQATYYLYQIDAEIYPTRAGEINAGDVKIVVDYPIAVGSTDDDFFGSAFGQRLAVTQTRPIVAEVEPDATEVVPVPSDGRPADYRGAVGNYKIVTDASPTQVQAGDSIQLTIGIIGTGPMELVQAPPLSELPELSEFKIPSEPLAGIVENDVKYFLVNVRPRAAGITEIPSIPFSFFDPDAEHFVTVRSEPIAITVEPSDAFNLDAIVSGQKLDKSSDSGALSQSRQPTVPSFENEVSAGILISQSRPESNRWWWIVAIGCPLILVATLILRNASALIAGLSRVRSPQSRCMAELGRARTGEEICLALNRLVCRQLNSPADVQPTTTDAAGALRSAGMYSAAVHLESLAVPSETSRYQTEDPQQLDAGKLAAKEFADRFQSEVGSRRLFVKGSSNKSKWRVAKSGGMGVVLLGFLCPGLSAFELEAISPRTELTQSQREVLLQEASEAYQNAMHYRESDRLSAIDYFESAAAKYQALADSGIQNSRLWINLGNAYLQSGQLGRAIANYRRAQRLAPRNPQLKDLLQFAESKVTHNQAGVAASETEHSFYRSQVLALNGAVLNRIGIAQVQRWVLIASVFFWGILTLRAVGYSFRVWWWAAVPGLLLLLSLATLGIAATGPSDGNAIIVAADVELRSGDGDGFDIVASLQSSEGRSVTLITERGKWALVETPSGQTGWIDRAKLERF